MKKLSFVFLLLVFVLVACDGSGDKSPTSPAISVKPDSRSGMMSVSAFGVTTVLGTDVLESRANERPSMDVRFEYDFSLGRHEVTCSEFNQLMRPATGLEVACEKDSLPVTNITYFDAVLFANERSKSEKFDTAYTYSSTSFDAEGHCLNLEGIIFHPEVDAFRLPTEAEWVLAASQDWNLKNGWIGENSENTLHEVCSLDSAKSGFCDLIGNAMEWVNDWLGAFADTVVSNYVGAPDGGALGERIVKGGCFRSASESITLYGRGDVYMVTSSTRADYVGFRLAYGSIPNAVWMGSNGLVKSSRVIPSASSAMVRDFVGTLRAKLAFRNDQTGNLSYIDYSNGFTSVVEIADTIDVYHPEISPDGKHVAFCTGLEGVRGESSVYVRDLNTTGTNLVRLDVRAAAIPRWRVLETGDTVIVYVTSADNNKDESSFKETSTWQVKFENGKFGTPQKLFDGAYHGGISDDGNLAVTGARLLRANVLGHDTVWYDSAQACNASLARDNSKRTLFLDFGGQPGREFVGESYGTHERLLLVDSVGRLLQSVAAPSRWTFDHSEWISGSGDIAVVSLVNENGGHTKISLVNISDGNFVDLVRGDELWHPSFWVKSASVLGAVSQLDLDSAGMYFRRNDENHLTAPSVEVAIKLQNFWKRYNDIECAVFGSSMLMDAVIEDSIKTFKTLNMGVTLSDLHLFDAIIRRYLFPYASNLKAIVVELSPGFLYRVEEEYYGFIRMYSPGLVYDENHLNQDNFKSISYLSQDVDLPRDLFIQDYMEGMFLLPSVSWGEIYCISDLNTLQFENSVLQENLQKLIQLKKDSEEKGIQLVLAITPRNPAFAQEEAFDMWGPSRVVAHQIFEFLRDSNIVIFDENKDGLHDYSSKMAYDNSHLSYLGAAVFSTRLDSFLSTLK